MKPFLIALIFAAVTTTAAVIVKAKRKPVGRCEPYAEVCRHCTDCSQCAHCSKSGGKCSVCF